MQTQLSLLSWGRSGGGGGSSCQLQGVPSQISCPLTHQHTEEALRSRKASYRATYQGVCTF